MWLSLASSEALRHERWGKYCLCLNTQPSTKPLPHFPSGGVPLKKKKIWERERDTDTLCCETLIATAAVCLQLEKEQCRSCEHGCTRGCEHIYECQCISVCTPVWSPFALVFYKCGGGGCALSRHSGCIYYQQMWRCLGMGCLCWASHFYLRSTDVLCKACVGRAGFKKETANWPGYGLLQLNLKH